MNIESKCLDPYLIQVEDDYYCVQRKTEGTRKDEKVNLLVNPKYFTNIENCLKYILIQRVNHAPADKETIELKEYYDKIVEIKNQILSDASIHL